MTTSDTSVFPPRSKANEQASYEWFLSHCRSQLALLGAADESDEACEDRDEALIDEEAVAGAREENHQSMMARLRIQVSDVYVWCNNV